MYTQPTHADPVAHVNNNDGPATSAHWWILAGLIVLGGIMRFSFLTQPCLWGDEGYTFGRVCGTYQQLLDVLKDDGFVPLHYELYWVIGRFVKLTPWVMRLAPALAGTLMIPAIYFLARQLVRPRTSLLAAAFTTCSGYMLAYSRDAKMYMIFWLFLTLHIACLLWWMRTGKRLAWLLWIAMGTAAVGLHSAGWLLMPIEAIILLSRPGKLKWRGPILFVVGVLIIAAGPAGYYLSFNNWSQRSGGIAPGVSITSAQQDTPAKQPDWQQSGLTWIEDNLRNKSGLELVKDSATAYLFSYSRAEEQREKRGHIPIPHWILLASASALGVLLSLMALGALPWPVQWRDRGEIIPGPEPWWRSTLWLGMWLVLPTYGFFYCRSVDGFVSPMNWLTTIGDAFGQHWWWMAGGIIALCILMTRCRFVVGIAAAAIVIFVAATLLIARIRMPGDWLACWSNLLNSPWTWWLKILIFVPGIWYFCGKTFEERWKKAGTLGLIAGIIFTLCAGAFYTWDHLHQIAMAKNPKIEWQAIWMPRYLGIAWPAVAIATAALFMRLPTRLLRWGAIAFLLGINLLQGSARVWAMTEPPIDLVVRDILDSKKESATTRTYIQPWRSYQTPGGASVMDAVGRYYLTIETGRTTTPMEIRHGSMAKFAQLWIYRDPRRLAADMTREPKIQKLILWREIKSGPREKTDRVLATLGPKWKLKNEQEFSVHRYWNWQQLGIYQKREYEKKIGQ